MVVRKSVIVLTIALVSVLSGSVVAVAAHTFTDVPTNHVFHNDISWLADTGVTRGCNPPTNDQYCPDDNLTRGQMAAFLHRFADLPVETTIAIDQIGFTPLADGSAGYLDYDYYALGHLGRASTQGLGASVPVPDGATITGFSATVCDSHGSADITVKLLRRPDPALTGALPEVIGEVTSTGNSCAMTLTASSIANPVVDTANYSYAVEARFSAGGSGLMRRVTVTYERPLLP